MNTTYPPNEDEPLGIAREGAVSYEQKAYQVSGLESLLEKDRLALSNFIKGGLPYALFDKIVGFTRFSEQEWAGFLGISTKSLQRYKQDRKTFKPLQSEKIIEILEVSVLGHDVFGSADRFYLWLQTPSFALGNHAPIHLLGDSYGKELVLSALTRIDHGIFI